MSQQKVEKHQQHVEDYNDTEGVYNKKLQGVNARLILTNLWSLTGPMNYGYMAASIGSTLGQPNFYSYNTAIDSATLKGQNIIGTIVGMQSLGGAIGVILVCFLQDRYGRKAGFLFGIIISLIGAGLGAGFRHYIMLMIARLCSGAGGWSSILSAITYQMEIAPTTRRGILGGTIGPAITFGYVQAAWASVGFYYLNSNINYRAALIIQVLWPLVTLAGLPFVPESPRWLIYNDRHTQALTILQKFYETKKDPEHIVARDEAHHIKAQSVVDRTLRNDWVSMFTIYKRRTWIVILLLFSVQAGGIQVVTNYGPVIYQSVGFTASQSLMLAGGWYIAAYASDVFWSLFIEVWGRRPLIVVGQIHTAIALAVMIALIAKFTPPSPDAGNAAGGKATIFMFYYFVFAYSTSEPTYYVYMGEIFPTHIRVKGVAIALATLNLTSFWVTLSQPAGVGACGWKFYLVFLVITVLDAAALWYFIKETKGLALEDIAKVFGDSDHVASDAVYRDALTNVHAGDDKGLKQ